MQLKCLSRGHCGHFPKKRRPYCRPQIPSSLLWGPQKGTPVFGETSTSVLNQIVPKFGHSTPRLHRMAMALQKQKRGFPRIGGNHFGGPDTKDHSLLGPIFGSPYLWKLPNNTSCGFAEWLPSSRNAANIFVAQAGQVNAEFEKQ